MMLRYAAGFLALGLTHCAIASPSFQEVKAGWRSSEAYLLDRHGEVLHQLRLDPKVRRLEWSNLKDISPALRKAVLHAEDRHFDDHDGVDWMALGEAALSNLTGKGRRGASTITMQVAAMLDSGLAPKNGKRSLSQKWDQISAARALDSIWSKEEILETYLNLATFRGELQGIASASHALFGKSPSGLTEAESVLLASLLPSPNASSAQVARRACILSGEMSCAGLQQMARIALQGSEIRMAEAWAPHVAHKLLHAPGEGIRSTLDGKLQRFATETLRRQLHDLAGRNVSDGAVLVMDNTSGEVLAYVGNVGAQSSARFVDGVSAFRQAGSTLKPFLYGVAIEEKLLTAASLVDDTPVMLPTSNGLYVPQDYDKEFKGIVSVRTALAGSLNVPAVRTLTLVGGDLFYEKLKRLGYQSLDESSEFYGFSLALGSADVSLWDQVNAYRSLANGGVWSRAKLEINQKQEKPKRVFSREAAFIISDILADRAARGLTFGLENALTTRFWTAVKTGTSKNMRDNWCIGYSSKYTVGVWVGNFDGKPMQDVSGMSGAAPVWHELMNYLHVREKSEKPMSPPQVIQAKVDFESIGESSRQEWFIKGTEVNNVVVAGGSKAKSHILYPVTGTVIALDPDIPTDRQAVFFEVAGDDGNFKLMLDGHLYSDGQALTKWYPVPGKHRLTLNSDGTTLDFVEFLVRDGGSVFSTAQRQRP
jgi:penicillin-binding protein 1C